MKNSSEKLSKKDEIMRKIFKSKKLLLSAWGCEEKDHYTYTEWTPFFKEFFGKVIVFSPRTSYFREGKEAMNKKFIKIIEKEKPDYIVLGLNYDEFYIDTFIKIKKTSPNSKIMNFFADDEWRYDDWSRFYALFLDYVWVAEENLPGYKKDKIPNVVFLHGSSSKEFKHLNLEKEYDVSFIGAPIADRAEYARFLYKNGIKIRVFGKGWEKYSDLAPIYGGYLDSKEYLETLNKSKINLSFSKGALPGSLGGQLKGRVFEIAACKQFGLIEETVRNPDFVKKNKKLTFKTKQELLDKIKYFLKKENEREKFAESFYKDFIGKYTWESQFEKFFKKTLNKKTNPKGLPKIGKKVIIISKKDFENVAQLKQKIKNMDYIVFDEENSQSLPYRDIFQAYSLEKSKKNISCCDYYTYSESLGNYLLFMAKKAFFHIPKKDFVDLLNISQLMVTKTYFLKNLKKFKEVLLSGKEASFINEKNTTFVSIPLVRIKQLKKANYESMKKAFRMLFLDKIYSLGYQKNFFTLYLLKLLKNTILNNNFFILKYLKEAIFNKENWIRLKVSFS